MQKVYNCMILKSYFAVFLLETSKIKNLTPMCRIYVLLDIFCQKTWKM